MTQTADHQATHKTASYLTPNGLQSNHLRKEEKKAGRKVEIGEPKITII
jgi:hypothetical protein